MAKPSAAMDMLSVEDFGRRCGLKAFRRGIVVRSSDTRQCGDRVEMANCAGHLRGAPGPLRHKEFLRDSSRPRRLRHLEDRTETKCPRMPSHLRLRLQFRGRLDLR